MSLPKHTFFCADINFGVLNEEESHHAYKVLRMRMGDEFYVVDGRGRKAHAKITSEDRREIGFDIIEEVEIEGHPLHIHIAIAPTKNIDRFNFFLEKVTEMGCQEITPIFTKTSERTILKTEKARKTIISGLKQSGNLYMPTLNEPLEILKFFEQNPTADVKLIAHCEEDEQKVKMADYLEKGQTVLILIGPEGDFTSEEVILAKENGFRSVSLGDARFRTETAGVIACHTAYLYI